MRAFVLTYHSHNIGGTDYATNDHVAFASDLRTLTELGARIVSLDSIADALGGGLRGAADDVAVGISFDDGPLFDFADFVHPRFGPQRSLLNIMRDFRAELGSRVQPGMHATSFVIASAEARSAMERSEESGYQSLGAWLTDSWWDEAIESGYLGIGNHGWDHVHHAVGRTAITSDERDNFSVVDNYVDADREIRRAAAYIGARTAGRCTLFAYPFGHVNTYLVQEYFPSRGFEHGMKAAFGVDGRELRPDDSIWNIPRMVCGYHWKSPDGLAAFVKG